MSNVTSSIDATSGHELLSALGEQLAARGEHYELVVIGGAALLALGLVDRVTRDIEDVDASS